ncbi:hypothetical protein MRX96_058918 [Rhipicephalus microplus]
MNSPLTEETSSNNVREDLSNSFGLSVSRLDYQDANTWEDDMYDLYDSDSLDVTDTVHRDIDDGDWVETSSSPNSGTWAVHSSRAQRASRDMDDSEPHRSHSDTSSQEELGTSQEEELPLLDSECSHKKRDDKVCSKQVASPDPTALAPDLRYSDKNTRDTFDSSSDSRVIALQNTCRQTGEKKESKMGRRTFTSDADSIKQGATGNALESGSWNEQRRAWREDEDSSASDEDFDIASRNQHRTINGIPLLFKKLNDTPPAFSEVCLCCAEQHIAAATHEAPLGLEVTRKGFLRVAVETTTAASILQDMDNLGGISVQVVLPRGYSDNVAKISNVPLVYTDAQIRKFFAPAGVVSAKRQVAYRTQQDGSIKTIPRDSVLLTFRPEREIPVRIRPAVEYAEAFDYRYFPVRLHVTSPMQCYNCFRYGHMAKHCRRPVRCKVCAGDHSYKDCVSRFGQRCGNCDGPPRRDLRQMSRATGSGARQAVRAQVRP